MTFAALAAAAWGISDFLAGLLARRLPILTILIWSKVAAMALAVLAAAFRAAPPPADPRLWLAVVAGLAGLPAMGLLYRAMRDGSLAVVAPVAAVAALVPVAWGVMHGERPGLLAALGVTAGLAGATLAGWPVSGVMAHRRVQRSANLCALGAAIGFGVYFVLLHEAGAADQFWSVAYARIAEGVAALLLVVGLSRRRTPVAGQSERHDSLEGLSRRRDPDVALGRRRDPGVGLSRQRDPDLGLSRWRSPAARRAAAPIRRPEGKRSHGSAKGRHLAVTHRHPQPPRAGGEFSAPRDGGIGYPQGFRELGTRLAIPIFIVGATDAVADAAFIAAASTALAPAAVVASLYPAVTLLLNRSLLRERLHTVHLYGVLAALFAVACLAR
ncbi:EamA family transporter [Paractinoplanes ovalisporus]|uniref:EamA family transporter n=1 Tax=Paractinoplanes ovalisporus TaxID=2810368 RepID=UPI001F40D8E0|nr:EamA family transporter [Actinoplanes ovalisporus]